MKKVFLEISQNSQENTSTRVSLLIKLQAPPFFTEHLWWLLLNLVDIGFTFTKMDSATNILNAAF